MTDEQAKRQAIKRWGKRACWRNAGSFSGPERRQAAADQVAELKAKRDAILRERAERLRALGWWDEMGAEIDVLNKQIRETIPATHYHRFDVGKLVGVAGVRFFEILGSGDTWQEAFDAADRK